MYLLIPKLFFLIESIFFNGYVYETFGISKHFPVKLQVLLIRAETLDNPLTAKCFIYDVVAVVLKESKYLLHHRTHLIVQYLFSLP
jgi:hypothetical protein